MDIITILIIPIQKYGISFICPFQLIPSIFYSFQYTDLLLPWLKLFFSILFDAVVNKTVSLFSLSAISLLVYRNTTDFSVLILLSCNFTELFIVTVPGGVFSVLYKASCHLQIVTILILPFPT